MLSNFGSVNLLELSTEYTNMSLEGEECVRQFNGRLKFDDKRTVAVE